MRKRLTVLFLIMSFLMLLASCNIQSKEEYQKQNKDEQSIQATKEETVSKKEDKESNSSATDSLASSNTVEETVESKDSDKEVAKQVAKSSNEGTKEKTELDKDTNQSLTTKQSTSRKTETNKTATKKEDIKSETPVVQPKPVTAVVQPKPVTPVVVEPAKDYVTISIRVDTILNNMDKLDKSLQSEKYVPRNGIIVQTTKYELAKNETVFDILVRATREYKVHMEYQGASENQFGSAYIEGINHLYEFSVGELSGWMYAVNGSYPGYGASKYVLKNGDKIEWKYTCDLGRDLGVTWLDE